jgi:triosephosphate isomerase
MRMRLAAGNWKMNGTGASLAEIEALMARHPSPPIEILVCPPATLIDRAARLRGGHPLRLGGQDCAPEASGAHTGDISAAMLVDAGASHVILGHSERRQSHGETDALVRRKAEAAWAAGLVALVCVGETLAEREAGRTLTAVAAQLDGSIPDGATAASTVVAYEPVWAIGTGLTPTPEQIAEVHGAMRARLSARLGAEAAFLRLLYGGSVKASNAAEIFALPEVDGALVGGASLRADDFSPIVAALAAAAQLDGPP